MHSWFEHFIELQGTSVLGQTLAHISRKGGSRREADIQLEYKVVMGLKQILNIPVSVSPPMRAIHRLTID